MRELDRNKGIDNMEKYEDERLGVAKAMQESGCSFARELGKALEKADLDNTRRIKRAFPEFWDRYAERGVKGYKKEQLSEEDMQTLVDMVLNHIETEIRGYDDLTCLEELLKLTPQEYLLGYLDEEVKEGFLSSIAQRQASETPNTPLPEGN